MAQQPEVRQAGIVAHGRIEGNTIVLDEPTGLPDGAKVDVSIEALYVEAPTEMTTEEWLAQPVFGMWADREDMADSAEWVARQRAAWQDRLRPDS